MRDDSSYISWTGSGFLRITEGGQIQIIVDNIPVSGDYEIVLRYEPLVSGNHLCLDKDIVIWVFYFLFVERLTYIIRPHDHFKMGAKLNSVY